MRVSEVFRDYLGSGALGAYRSHQNTPAYRQAGVGRIETQALSATVCANSRSDYRLFKDTHTEFVHLGFCEGFWKPQEILSGYRKDSFAFWKFQIKSR